MRYLITDTSERNRSLSLLDGLVQDYRAYSCHPLHPTELARIFIYPIAPGGLLQRYQLRALEDAALEVFDTQAYVVATEGWDPTSRKFLAEPVITGVDLSDYEAYSEPRLQDGFFMQDNVVMSPQGAWAILMCHSGHAVGCGEASMVSALEERLPTTESMINQWLGLWAEEWGGNPEKELAWVLVQLKDIVGAELAEKLWRDHGFVLPEPCREAGPSAENERC